MASEEVQRAAEVLRRGGLVAFPTETVYGLGADATNPVAVRRIFQAKGRPGTNPLIVHVADAEVARRYAAAWSDAAQRLADAFWPGPLTLVLPKTPDIAPEVTASLATVGLRVPDHALALELLRAFDGPVAAPSANQSTHVSPTTAAHVCDDLGDTVDAILDGGPCAVGIESTVLDLSGPAPRILRPGGVTRERLEAVIGPLELVAARADVATPAASPGQHAVHYAPRTPTQRFEARHRPGVERIARRRSHEPLGFLFFGRGDDAPPAGDAGDPPRSRACVRWMPTDPAAYARELYASLRDLDGQFLTTIYVEMPPRAPEWTAVRDRLTRAGKPM
jgi:L-threonylcarbamoyladenylate synthase